MHHLYLAIAIVTEIIAGMVVLSVFSKSVPH
jgi:hypothetical protein